MPVTRHVLANGLEVFTLENPTLPIISFYTFFRTGSRNEPVGRSGISHLFEHIMFNGAKRYGPKEFDRQLESNGGYSNAYTTEDMTVYYEDFPADRLELVIDMESDRMTNLALTEESLASEREVVKEERRVYVDNSVEGHIFELLSSLAFTTHPYRNPVAGWMTDLDAITVEDCRRYYSMHYAPNNAVIVLVGDFQTDVAMDLIRRYYESIPAQAPAPPVRTVEPPPYGERRATLYKYAELPVLLIGYRAVAAQNPDVFTLDILQMLLGRGESSRLYRKLVYDEQIAIEVSVSFPWMLDPGLFTFYITLKPGERHEKAEQLLYEELERLKNEPVTEQELRKAKNILEAGLVGDLETNGGKADKIGNYALLFGDWSMLTQTMTRYESVTAKDVMAAARTLFSDRGRNIVFMMPEEKP